MSDATIVVSDATPLNILVRTGLVNVLAKLYAHVYIPPAVASELSHGNTPAIVRDWVVAKPAWLEIRAPTTLYESGARHPGEREAISLALELKAHYVLLDEKHARKVARKLNLNVVGTVGILELAAERGLVDIGIALQRLRETDFYLDEAIIRATLERAARRKQPDQTPPPQT